MLDQLRAHIEKIVPLDDQEFELMTAFLRIKSLKNISF